jgi:hypothetical protein
MSGLSITILRDHHFPCRLSTATAVDWAGQSRKSRNIHTMPARLCHRLAIATARGTTDKTTPSTCEDLSLVKAAACEDVSWALNIRYQVWSIHQYIFCLSQPYPRHNSLCAGNKLGTVSDGNDIQEDCGKHPLI